jgi:hypothetical protein
MTTTPPIPTISTCLFLGTESTGKTSVIDALVNGYCHNHHNHHNHHNLEDKHSIPVIQSNLRSSNPTNEMPTAIEIPKLRTFSCRDNNGAQIDVKLLDFPRGRYSTVIKQACQRVRPPLICLNLWSETFCTDLGVIRKNSPNFSNNHDNSTIVDDYYGDKSENLFAPTPNQTQPLKKPTKDLLMNITKLTAQYNALYSHSTMAIPLSVSEVSKDGNFQDDFAPNSILDCNDPSNNIDSNFPNLRNVIITPDKVLSSPLAELINIVSTVLPPPDSLSSSTTPPHVATYHPYYITLLNGCDKFHNERQVEESCSIIKKALFYLLPLGTIPIVIPTSTYKYGGIKYDPFLNLDSNTSVFNLTIEKAIQKYFFYYFSKAFFDQKWDIIDLEDGDNVSVDHNLVIDDDWYGEVFGMGFLEGSNGEDEITRQSDDIASSLSHSQSFNGGNSLLTSQGLSPIGVGSDLGDELKNAQNCENTQKTPEKRQHSIQTRELRPDLDEYLKITEFILIGNLNDCEIRGEGASLS